MLILGVTRWSGPKVQIMPSNSVWKPTFWTVSRVGNFTKKKTPGFSHPELRHSVRKIFVRPSIGHTVGNVSKTFQSFMDLVLLKRWEEDSVEDVEFIPCDSQISIKCLSPGEMARNDWSGQSRSGFDYEYSNLWILQYPTDCRFVTIPTEKPSCDPIRITTWPPTHLPT